MKLGMAVRPGKMTIKRAFLSIVVPVGIALLFLGVLAGCGVGSKSGTPQSSAPADKQTAPGGTARPQLLLFTSPG